VTPGEFCYWLQGIFEIGDIKQLDERQTAIVRDHLREVFTKVTPDRPPAGHEIDPDERRHLLDEIRDAARAQGPQPRRLCGDGQRFC
jgi:hypothetical protein